MRDFSKTAFMIELGMLTDKLAENGWHERNSGNISVLLDETEIKHIIKHNIIKRTIDLEVEVKELKGKLFFSNRFRKVFKKMLVRIQN